MVAAVVFLLLLHAALAWRLRTLSLVPTPDAATYLAVSRSVRALGYRSVYQLGAPRHVLYPPGWPTVLALLSLVAGERLDVVVALEVALSTATLALLFDVVRRAWSPTVALLVLAACAVNPLLLEYAGVALSEVPFMFLTTLCVWAAQRARAQPRYAPLAGAAAVAAMLVRSAGVAVVAALVVLWLVERRRRAAIGLVAVGGACATLWVAWVLSAPAPARQASYAADLQRGYARPAGVAAVAAPSLPARVLARVPRNAADYARQLPDALAFPRRVNGWTRHVPVQLLVLALAVAALAALFRRWAAAALVVACYAAVLLVWPWALPRFLVPALPLGMVAFVGGAWALGARLGRWRWIPAAAAAALVVVTAARADARAVRASAACDRAQPLGAPACHTPLTFAVLGALRWVADSTPRDAVVGARSGALVSWYAHRRTVPLRDAVAAADDAPAYVVVWRRGGARRPVLDDATPATCARLGLARAWGSDVQLFRVLPNGVAASDSAACRLLPGPGE
ncbi:hypothetical protein J421_5501 (plasmid) [Gemmatirosa kalamazoonensis]|uniref:Glycosyltransferase RgtA/B/C/D-like domain-containing protein n=1 Tax=Gemmatirosa kalamazoonensis TaxID=861299 RepID=W0RQP1_9BACT|nr:glycosyltransferase family 39 protein [Gemmatirosa kalamazoonensis]AHG93036.1 hypothetical protein J421_5501 [Gemmatirosa kalamazoonensis]